MQSARIVSKSQFKAKALRYFREAGESGSEIIIAWEVAQLAQRGQLQLTMEVTEWIAKSEALPFLHFVPVNNRIAVRAVPDQPFLDRATERAMRSSLKMVLNSMFLLIHSLLLITESVIAPR